MANSVATPLEKQFSTIAGVTSISSSNGLGSTNITLQFDLSRDIDSAAQDVQSMIARAQRSLPPGMPSPPSYQKVEPGRSAGPLPDAQLEDDAAVAGRPVRRVGARATAVDGQRRRRRQRVRRAEVRRPHRRRSDASWRHARSGSTRSRRPSRARTSNRPTGTLYGPQRNFVVQTSGQLMDAEGYRAGRRRLQERQPGPTQRGRKRLRRRREPAQRQLVQRHAGDLPRDRAAAGHEHGRGRRPHQGAAAAAPVAASGLARPPDPQRPLRLDSRVGRGRQVHAAS